MFEHKRQELAPVSVFIRRLAASVAVSGCLIAASLFIGIAGYRWIAGFGWADALLNASMILGGMGPVDTLPTKAAKISASGYALFSGLMFIVVMGIILAPIVRRILHAFHVDESDLRE
ncbi:hypothetical protein FJY63_07875 [Candidatus Sumerlaeota bacterium]|nr:hypothetical protein [Candidatus Sumerlaeota bacterium]